MMKRYKDRQPQLTDLIERFEEKPSSTHVRNALGVIERLKDEGAHFWTEGSPQLARWREGLTTLWVFLNNIGSRMHKQDLATASREFIQEFEHTTGRLNQMLYGIPDDHENYPRIDPILRWIEMLYRASTYALISSWIPDKTEEGHLKITVSLTKGVISEEWDRREMNVPKKYRCATNHLS